MGLSTADSKQVLCHMILFKVLSLGLLRSLWVNYGLKKFNTICFEMDNLRVDLRMAARQLGSSAARLFWQKGEKHKRRLFYN
jgi:hypothetical protein